MKSVAVELEQARYQRTRGRVILAVAVAAAVLSVAVTLSPLASGFADATGRGPGDVGLYRAEVDRIHAGEGYYQAVGEELRSRGYPTKSVFNWRTPLPIAAIGWLPEPVAAKVLLGALALVLLLSSFGLIADECGMKSAVLTALAMTGAVLPCILGNLYVMSELWSGVLIALSVVALGRGKTKLGVLAGTSALFLRELAALYCVVAVALAMRDRRWREVFGWALGLSAYTVYFVVHAWNVLGLIQPDDIAHQQGWIQFAGAGFVISTVQMNSYLLLLPQWVSSIYLVLALVGFTAWHSPNNEQASDSVGCGSELAGLTAVAYLAAFAVVGQPFNQYWGSLIAPLLCLGAGHGVVACAGLWKVAIADQRCVIAAKLGA